MASAKYALDLNQRSGREVAGGSKGGKQEESVAPPLCVQLGLILLRGAKK